MIRLRFFLDEPRGKTCIHFEEMPPRLGREPGIKVDATALPREECRREGYISSGLPAAPAIMINDEVVIQGAGLARPSWVCRRPSRPPVPRHDAEGMNHDHG
ncbi:MAG: NEPxGxxU motif selenoprotein TsoC [Thermodesulfobacteriota bacterium]